MTEKLTDDCGSLPLMLSIHCIALLFLMLQLIQNRMTMIETLTFKLSMIIFIMYCLSTNLMPFELLKRIVTISCVTLNSCCDVGVRVDKGKDANIFAPMIISDAGVLNTLQSLLPRQVAAKSSKSLTEAQSSQSITCRYFVHIIFMLP